MPDSQIDVSIIIVSYNSSNDLRECLASVYEQTQNIKLEIFVVDNNSNDSTPKMVEEEFPAVRVIANSENAGFAKANNQAIVRSSGRNILLLNPDTVILENAVEKMLTFLDANKNIDAVGCKLLNDDGTTQYSICNFPTLVNQSAMALFLHRMFPSVKVFCEIVTSKEYYEKDHDVDWVFGAVLMIRRETIKEVGLLDEDYFLFSEEKDWCYKTKLAGRKIRYYHDAKIIHHGRGSNTTPEVYTQLLFSNLLFFKKYHGIIYYQVLRIVLTLSTFLRILVWFLIDRASSKHKDEAKANLKCYRMALVQILRSGSKADHKFI